MNVLEGFGGAEFAKVKCIIHIPFICVVAAPHAVETKTFFTNLINLMLAIFLIAEGSLALISGGYYNQVKIPLIIIPGAYAGVLPISFIMMAILLIALNFKFGARAIPILMMAIGAFDVLGNLAGIPWYGIAWYFSSDKIWYFQVGLMIVGYLLACPIEDGKIVFLKFKLDPVFALLCGTFAACMVIDFSYNQKIYHIYEAVLYLWVWHASNYKEGGPVRPPQNVPAL